jgi:DNA-binding Lrp family transcriptional regulator
LDSNIVSELDLALVNALQLQPRADWGHLARALGVTPATAARRWRRLESEGLAWVAITAGHRHEAVASSAFVLVGCSTRDQTAVADALAREAPVATMATTMGDRQLLLDVLLPDLPSLRDYLGGALLEVPGVRDVSALLATRIYRAGSDWRIGALDRGQQQHLDDWRLGATPFVIDDVDRALIAELTRDARSSWSELAIRCDISAPTARRRVTRLLEGEVVELRCELADVLSGPTVHVTFLAEVDGSRLDAAGAYLSGLPKCRLAAAVVGRENLLATMWFASASEIAQFEAALTGKVPGLRVRDRIVHLRTVKRVGHVLDAEQRSREVVPLAVW